MRDGAVDVRSIEELEALAAKTAKRTRNSIPEGWWRNMFTRSEVQALLGTRRWKLDRVTGKMKLPGVRPVIVSQVFMRKA